MPHRPAAVAPATGKPAKERTDMERFITRGPPADDGYALDSQLDQMADDGCPIVPEPVRWADDDWRDNLGEYDTFADDVGLELPPGSPGLHAGSSVRVNNHPAAVWTPRLSRDGGVRDP
jgi:hypothetical protein